MTMCKMKGVILVWKGKETRRESAREREIMADGRSKGSLEIEICATEQNKGGWEVGWVSFQILPGHVNREDRATRREYECEWASSPVCQCCTVLAQKCHWQRLTSWGPLHSPTPNEHLFTEFTEYIVFTLLHSKYKVTMGCLFTVVTPLLVFHHYLWSALLSYSAIIQFEWYHFYCKVRLVLADIFPFINWFHESWISK